MIIFGWYSFKLNEFTTQTPCLKGLMEGTHPIEVRQKCLHIFWIPMLPIGKSFILHAAGKKYDAPPQMIQILKQEKMIRSSWYYFIVPIILALMICYGIVSNEVRQILNASNLFHRNQNIEYVEVLPEYTVRR